MSGHYSMDKLLRGLKDSFWARLLRIGSKKKLFRRWCFLIGAQGITLCKANESIRCIFGVLDNYEQQLSKVSRNQLRALIVETRPLVRRIHNSTNQILLKALFRLPNHPISFSVSFRSGLAQHFTIDSRYRICSSKKKHKT